MPRSGDCDVLGQMIRERANEVYSTGSLYWWAGRDAAYIIGGVGMSLVTAVAWRGLVDPAMDEMKKKA